MKVLNKKELKKFYLLLVPILVIGFALAAYAETENEYYDDGTDLPVAELSGEFKYVYDNELIQKVETVNKFTLNQDALKMERVSNIMEVTSLPEEAAMTIVKYSKKFGIRTSLLLAMMELESDFKKYEVGTHNDRGYMQIIPGTEKWLAEEYGEMIELKYNPERIFEEEYNIGLSALYINILSNAYGDNFNRILSEYNRGPYNLKEYYQKHGTYSTGYSNKILFLEKKYESLNS